MGLWRPLWRRNNHFHFSNSEIFHASYLEVTFSWKLWLMALEIARDIFLVDYSPAETGGHEGNAGGFWKLRSQNLKYGFGPRYRVLWASGGQWWAQWWACPPPGPPPRFPFCRLLTLRNLIFPVFQIPLVFSRICLLLSIPPCHSPSSGFHSLSTGQEQEFLDDSVFPLHSQQCFQNYRSNTNLASFFSPVKELVSGRTGWVCSPA